MKNEQLRRYYSNIHHSGHDSGIKLSDAVCRIIKVISAAGTVSTSSLNLLRGPPMDTVDLRASTTKSAASDRAQNSIDPQAEYPRINHPNSETWHCSKNPQLTYRRTPKYFLWDPHRRQCSRNATFGKSAT
jgi:hypothetical protein